MGQDYVTKFERSVLFRIARFVAFSICFLLFLGLLGGAIYLALSSVPTVDKPNPLEVVQSLKPVPAQTARADGNAAPATVPHALLKGIKLPAGLQELMLSPENQQWLRSGLDELPDDQQQQCVDDMAVAVAEAIKGGIADNEAAEAWMLRCHAYANERVLADAATNMQRLYTASALLSMLILIALFSLVLVLMAIERNTRPRQDADLTP